MKPDAAQIVAHPHSLPLKHHDFIKKQEIKNLLDARIICKSMSPWASPIVVVKKHAPEGAPQQFLLMHQLQKSKLLITNSNTSSGHKERHFHTYAPAQN